MATFAALDKRMMRDVDRLHNYLWHAEEKIDGPKLLADLASEARDLDALLKAGGTLRRHASAIAQDTANDKGRYGPALFELLTDSYVEDEFLSDLLRVTGQEQPTDRDRHDAAPHDHQD